MRHGGEPTISTGESYQNTTVCRSTQIRQRTCLNQLVLRDDCTLVDMRVLVLC